MGLGTIASAVGDYFNREKQAEATDAYEQANNAYTKAMNAAYKLQSQQYDNQQLVGRGQMSNRGVKVEYANADTAQLDAPGGKL